MDLNTIRDRTLTILGEPFPENDIEIGPRDESPAVDRIIRAMAKKADGGDVQAAKVLVDLAKLKGE